MEKGLNELHKLMMRYVNENLQEIIDEKTSLFLRQNAAHFFVKLNMSNTKQITNQINNNTNKNKSLI